MCVARVFASTYIDKKYILSISPKEWHYNPMEISFYKKQARAGHVCLLGGVNHAQRRMNKPLSIGDCCQGDVVPIKGQCVMC